MLIKAFASGDTLKFNVIRQLSELRLDYGDDPYEFISKVRLIIERFDKYKIDVGNIIQFFIGEGMNNQFKEHLIQITNKGKPSLKEITENFFEACERYNTQGKQVKSGSKQSSKRMLLLPLLKILLPQAWQLI